MLGLKSFGNVILESRREVIVHCSLFVEKHDERNNPWSQLRHGVGSF